MEINEDILKRCGKNDRKAQYELYRVCYPLLMSICSRYHQNEIDSRAVLNEGFLKIILNLSKYSTQVPFNFWIRRIMLNTIIDHFRKEKNYITNTAHAEHADLQVVGGQDVTLRDNYDAEALLDLVRRLPKASGTVFNMFAIDGYSHFEISKLLGISEGTSKWHTSEARKKLSAMLKEEERFTLKLKSQ
ncbi:MAG: sigma-70 family RNA polymerase sigma factor [Chitinophagales bacterium]